MRATIKYSKSFTVLELLIVITILSIITGFAILGYQRLIESSYEKEANTTLKIITNAQRVYYAENNTYYAATDLNALNTGLRLKIMVTNKVTYSCTGGSSLECWGVYATTPWVIRTTSGSLANLNPHCIFGTCPTCQYLPTGCTQ